MRRCGQKYVGAEDEIWDEDSYFTYRPLSNLPTPPPSSRNSSAAQSPKTTLDDGEELQAKYRGPAVHLVNLIPSTASLANASIPLVQAMLTRADLPLETVALAVCILDSLDARFARTWRLSCPLLSGYIAPRSKRHTLPSSPFVHSQFPNQLHIDSVNPELIVLSALVIASKFTQDLQDSSHHYCENWGRGMWSAEQLNVTERCIMERLEYRIMPLCEESCITDAMVDMQLAGRHHDWHSRQPTPPESLTPHSVEGDFVPSHSRSKTMATTVGLGMLSMGLKGSSVAATGSSAS
ncbi:unnamed protein product [Clonostachys byssicola]|uniref:Cyclin-like protein n=1 Tax=Clonostachys byssicola TaxID=160290 RepID=A0A9N9U3Z6_9HYPO|nr:unnamed protein product [Clonostachys byssicola]